MKTIRILAALVFLSALGMAAFHHHTSGEEDYHCSLCAFAGNASANSGGVVEFLFLFCVFILKLFSARLFHFINLTRSNSRAPPFYLFE